MTRPRVQALLAGRTGCRVLEAGAGCLRNALYLLRQGLRVSVLESPRVEARFPDAYRTFRAEGGRVLYTLAQQRRFDLAIATFVIETICRPQDRKALLDTLRSSLTREGALVLSVRGPRDLVMVRARGRPCSDGYITPSKTFARAFTKQQLGALLNSTGFAKVDFLHRPTTAEPELLHVIAWAYGG